MTNKNTQNQQKPTENKQDKGNFIVNAIASIIGNIAGGAVGWSMADNFTKGNEPANIASRLYATQLCAKEGGKIAKNVLSMDIEKVAGAIGSVIGGLFALSKVKNDVASTIFSAPLLWAGELGGGQIAYQTIHQAGSVAKGSDKGLGEIIKTATQSIEQVVGEAEKQQKENNSKQQLSF